MIMSFQELADKIEALDEDSFASMLGFEYTHDDAPGRVKRMIVDALRFADQKGLAAPPISLDEAD